MMQRNVLVVGANGQLGHELSRTVPDSVKLTALGESDLDITDQVAVMELTNKNRPEYIINAAAYTAVDKAEEQADLAYRVNRDGAANLAEAAKQAGARLIHLSTDFIFDGNKSSPYLIDDDPNPLGVYGASKQAGDEAVISLMGDQALIIRTAWVYSSHGQNFVKTMLGLMSEREELGIVADQIGTPTWANGLARMIWLALDADLAGVHHWTDAGVASWYDFAVAVSEEATKLGLLSTDKNCRIKPIRTQDYPTPATRPACSVLDKTITWNALHITPDHWRIALRNMLQELAA